MEKDCLSRCSILYWRLGSRASDYYDVDGGGGRKRREEVEEEVLRGTLQKAIYAEESVT